MVAREPIIARVCDAQALAPGRRVGGADLRAVVGPDLGTGLGGWDLVLRKLAHAAEYAVLGALLARATGRPRLAFALAVLYAISDELHQLAAGPARGAAGRRDRRRGELTGIALWRYAPRRLA